MVKEVFIKSKDSNSEIIFNGSVEENSYTVNGLSAETKYSYSVVCITESNMFRR